VEGFCLISIKAFHIEQQKYIEHIDWIRIALQLVDIDVFSFIFFFNAILSNWYFETVEKAFKKLWK
jgi:hypothetical protein